MSCMTNAVDLDRRVSSGTALLFLTAIRSHSLYIWKALGVLYGENTKWPFHQFQYSYNAVSEQIPVNVREGIFFVGKLWFGDIFW
jgi:hypothetical protein